MSNIVYEIIKGEQIEQCRDLCNELMAYQQSKATLFPEIFNGMNFDTRLKKSFESTTDAQVVVVKDNGQPIGYVFSSIEDIKEGDKSYIPQWAPPKASDDYQGFYPDCEQLPAKCGCLNNLYLRDQYQHQGIGAKLYDMTMQWMKSYDDVEIVFVYISNGNDNALNFYVKHGFTFSHNVFGGFILAAYYKFNR